MKKLLALIGIFCMVTGVAVAQNTAVFSNSTSDKVPVTLHFKDGSSQKIDVPGTTIGATAGEPKKVDIGSKCIVKATVPGEQPPTTVDTCGGETKFIVTGSCVPGFGCFYSIASQ